MFGSEKSCNNFVEIPVAGEKKDVYKLKNFRRRVEKKTYA
jgi:hypothetical protein